MKWRELSETAQFSALIGGCCFVAAVLMILITTVVRECT